MKPFRIVIAVTVAATWVGAALGQAAQPARGSAPAPAPASVPPIPRATFIQSMDSDFRKMDADKNNILTRKEIEDYQRAVSTVEAQRLNQALFAALDKDRNGSLSAKEFAGLRMIVPQPNAAPILSQTDANRDGQVTLIEYRAGKLQNFDRMDADKDGIVSVAEMRAAGLIK